MLEAGDTICVAQDGSWHVEVDPFCKVFNVSTRCFRLLPIKRPCCINIEHVEFIEGDWNQEKTQYGIRIGFVSGAVRCFWGNTGRKVLESLLDLDADLDVGCLDLGDVKEILNKYDERVKAGPPTM